MKAFYFIIIVLLASCQLNTHSSKHYGHSEIRLLIDVTDKKLVWPTANSILNVFNCPQNPNESYGLKLCVISDKIHNESFSCELPDVEETERENKFDDPQHRNKHIQAFYQNVRNTLNSFYKKYDTTKPLSHSECWASICTQLQQLSEDTMSTRKVLIIYSDLLEKSTANAYTQLAEKSITSFGKALTALHPLPGDLSSITIVVIYRPETREVDKKFSLAYSVLKNLVEAKGGKIYTQSTNNIQP
jgi:hypothetical protein